MTLARHRYPTNAHHLVQKFEEATEKPYNHFLIDLKLTTLVNERLKSNIFKSHDNEYTIKEKAVSSSSYLAANIQSGQITEVDTRTPETIETTGEIEDIRDGIL